jgi:hypothetical protein
MEFHITLGSKGLTGANTSLLGDNGVVNAVSGSSKSSPNGAIWPNLDTLSETPF